MNGVQATCVDAVAGKLSAVVAGYYEDPYVGWLRPYDKRAPLINRGNYTRVSAVRMAVAEFCKQTGRLQIVNLGSGHDTLGWFVKDVLRPPDIRMFDVDFGEVLRRRAATLRSVPALWERVQQEERAASDESVAAFTNCQRDTLSLTADWVWVEGDLCRVEQLQQQLLAVGFDQDLPTLFIAECVLVYLERAKALQALRWMLSVCRGPVALHSYQPMTAEGPFSQQMAKNLEARGCPLLSASSSCEAAAEEVKKAGWEVVTVADLNAIHDKFVDKYEQARIQKLELLDELEEYHLVQSHYVCVAASRQLDAVGKLWAAEREIKQTQRRFSTAELRACLAQQSAAEMRERMAEAAGLTSLKAGALSALTIPAKMNAAAQPHALSSPWRIPCNQILAKPATIIHAMMMN